MKIEVHNHHYGAGCDVERIEAAIAALGDRILMAISAQTQAVLDRLDQATTNISEDITAVATELGALRDQIAAGTTTDEEVRAALDEKVTRLETAATALDTLASEDDPENPTP